MLCEFIRGGHFERHLNKMRTVYRGKRALLERALREAFGPSLEMRGNAGHHLLVSPGNGMSESELCAAAMKQGVRVYPISPYFIRGDPAEHRARCCWDMAAFPGKRSKRAWRFSKGVGDAAVDRKFFYMEQPFDEGTRKWICSACRPFSF